MDKQLFHLRLNISELASLSNMHRQTVSARLQHVPIAGGNGSNLKLYYLRDVLSELMSATSSQESEELEPQERKAWYQSERERLKFEQEIGELLPAADVAREFAAMAKMVIQVLETLPDILERDCALSPTVISRVQRSIDDLRDQLAERVSEKSESQDEEQNNNEESE